MKIEIELSPKNYQAFSLLAQLAGKSLAQGVSDEVNNTEFFFQDDPAAVSAKVFEHCCSREKRLSAAERLNAHFRRHQILYDPALVELDAQEAAGELEEAECLLLREAVRLLR